MRILFIGGTGNISAACARLALAQGHEVFLFNRGQRDLAALGLSGATVLKADWRDEAAAPAALDGRSFDVVADFVAFNAEDVARDVARLTGRCGQYLFISSASAYEKPMRHPFITESHPLKNPVSEYARAKIAAEEVCGRAWRDHDFPAVIVRPSHTYETMWPLAIGGGPHFTLVDRIRRGGEIVVPGDGTSLWTVTHAEDFARGFNGLFGLGAAAGHAFHITSDEVLPWNEIYTTLAAAAGVEPKLVPIPTDFLVALNPTLRAGLLGDKAHSIIFDNAKIKRFVPGFQAIIPFHVGARRTLAWFEADPARQVILPEINESMDRYLAAWRTALGTANT